MMNWTLDQAAQLATIAGFVIAAISFSALVYPAIRYVQIRSADLRYGRFETYHRLIREITGGKEDDPAPFVACQIAAVFELRDFTEYADVTIRVLGELSVAWGHSTDPAVISLLQEIDLTLAALKGPK